MGNVAGQRRAFQEAAEYREEWRRYEAKQEKWEATSDEDRDEKQEPPEPPKVDHGLETLARVLDGEILVHNHCYRADEMSLMLGLAKSFGFRLRTDTIAAEAKTAFDLTAESYGPQQGVPPTMLKLSGIEAFDLHKDHHFKYASRGLFQYITSNVLINHGSDSHGFTSRYRKRRPLQYAIYTKGDSFSRNLSGVKSLVM